MYLRIIHVKFKHNWTKGCGNTRKKQFLLQGKLKIFSFFLYILASHRGNTVYITLLQKKNEYRKLIVWITLVTWPTLGIITKGPHNNENEKTHPLIFQLRPVTKRSAHNFTIYTIQTSITRRSVSRPPTVQTNEGIRNWFGRSLCRKSVRIDAKNRRQHSALQSHIRRCISADNLLRV